MAKKKGSDGHDQGKPGSRKDFNEDIANRGKTTRDSTYRPVLDTQPPPPPQEPAKDKK